MWTLELFLNLGELLLSAGPRLLGALAASQLVGIDVLLDHEAYSQVPGARVFWLFGTSFRSQEGTFE